MKLQIIETVFCHGVKKWKNMNWLMQNQLIKIIYLLINMKHKYFELTYFWLYFNKKNEGWNEKIWIDYMQLFIYKIVIPPWTINILKLQIIETIEKVKKYELIKKCYFHYSQKIKCKNTIIYNRLKN